MWTPLFVPLVKGLDLSKDATLGEEELHTALNIDYSADGCIKGRPSRAASELFYVLDPVYPAATEPTYKASSTFANSGFTPSGLLRVKDGAGERVALATRGRLFYHEGTKWHDRGAFGCMRVDRLNANPDATITDPSTQRRTVAPDFSHCKTGGAGSPSEVWALFNSAGALEQRDLTTGTGTVTPGTGARNGTTTAAVSVTDTANNYLYSFYRANGAAALTEALLAIDARTPTDVGDAPVICPAHTGNYFYVVYRTTTAGVLKVLKIDFFGGTLWTYTSGVIAGLAGIWVDNTAGNVCVAFTHATGITIRQLDPATGAATGADCSDATAVGSDCVVGAETSSQAWWAYRAGGSYGDMVVGIATLGSGTTTVKRRFYGLNVSYPNAALRWSICHQPIKLDGRMYLSLACSGAAGFTATWLTLDLTNWYTTSALAAGPFSHPTIVARGPTAATYPHLQPSVASTLSDGTGFTFPTLDWLTFAANTTSLTGLTAQAARNRVTFSKPRVGFIGESNVFSGSAPRMVGRGDCVELGWPFLAGEPALDTDPAPPVAGTVPDGTYTLHAVWKWTDEAGQIHRSAPSPARQIVVTAPNSNIVARVVGPWLTEKMSRVELEVYCNSVGATTTFTLQGTAAWDPTTASAVSTAVSITSIVSGREELYTDGDVLPNYHVPADGGVTTVGRRMWVADANRVYATKLWTPGFGPEFNDDAANDQPSLFVNVPASAGRVVSLEALDDKLVVFCERGIYLVQDGGPNNVGVGSDFAPPLRISDLAIAGPRSSCVTDAGILFCTALDTVDSARGGPWLIDRQFTFTERQYLGRQAADFHLQTSGWVPEVAYSSERQQAFITTNVANSTSNGVVVIDLRSGKWAVWDTVSGTTGALRSISCVSGVLWALNDEPAPFSGTPGTDLYPAAAYAMVVKTGHLPANGQDGLGWARVRAASPLAADGTGAHTLTMTAILDKTRTLSSGAITVAAQSADTTWPTTRQAPEWRLPSQKCGSLQLQLSASPALARWSAIRLDVAPLPLRAPARSRT